jgi:hypothetical protein
MRLMRSTFGHRYMITDGWGRDLLPPDNVPGNQAGAQGGAAEQADAAQEVQLPEYRGWSQGAPSHGSGGRPGTTGPRGGCLGARPKTRGVTSSRGAPPTQGGVNQGGGQEDLVRGPVTHQCRRPASGQYIPKFQGGRGQDSGWYRHRRRDLPPTHHLHLDGAAGAGSDRAGGVEVSKGQSGCSLRAGRLPLTQGECRARYS